MNVSSIIVFCILAVITLVYCVLKAISIYKENKKGTKENENNKSKKQ